MTLRAIIAAAAIAAGLAATEPAQAGGAPKAEEGKAGPGFLPVGEVIVPVAVRGRLGGYIIVKASLEFESDAVAKSAEPWMPRIVDAWLRTVHGLAQRGHFDGAAVDPEMLKKQLLASSKTAIEGSEPSDVLLTQAFFTRSN